MTAQRDFRVVAFVAAYNESDIIVASLRRLLDDGVEVHVIDNWSTDGTYELVCDMVGRALVTVERFPATGPAPYFDLVAILARKEALALESGADWCIHADVDEIRCSPWPGVGLKDALRRVDEAGYNAVDHLVALFPPVDDNFESGTDFEAYFRHFVWDFSPFVPPQVRAWRNAGSIDLQSAAGHEARFDGRRIYPEPFLLKHFPIRSQAQGQRKVADRRSRIKPDELAAGWHVQYDRLAERAALLWPATALRDWDAAASLPTVVPDAEGRLQPTLDPEQRYLATTLTEEVQLHASYRSRLATLSAEQQDTREALARASELEAIAGAEAATLRSEVVSLRNSLIWRLTGPLREVGNRWLARTSAKRD